MARLQHPAARTPMLTRAVLLVSTRVSNKKERNINRIWVFLGGFSPERGGPTQGRWCCLLEISREEKSRRYLFRRRASHGVTFFRLSLYDTYDTLLRVGEKISLGVHPWGWVTFVCFLYCDRKHDVAGESHMFYNTTIPGTHKIVMALTVWLWCTYLVRSIWIIFYVQIRMVV